jgi:8-oxo-dGTP pyrophosphatase MutT (NUDIX family)
VIAPPLVRAGFPPEGQVFDVSSFRLTVAEGEHPWVRDNENAIAENWAREICSNPRLFNGRMVFQRALALADGHLDGVAHLVPYAAFLHWRRSDRSRGGLHLFALPIILSADNAVMMVRMADTTANPGRVYPPAGSLDESDIRDGLCDLEGNMRRETREETGLDLSDMVMDAGYRAVHMAGSVAMLRIFRSALPADELAAAAARHIAAEPEPEISALMGIRSTDPAAHDYPAFMPPVLDWIFRKGMT